MSTEAENMAAGTPEGEAPGADETTPAGGADQASEEAAVEGGDEAAAAGDEAAADGAQSADEESADTPEADADADDTDESAEEAPSPPPTDPRTLRIRMLEATVAEREKTLHEYIRAHKRSKTEFDAFRERLAGEQEEQVAAAKRKLVERLLPVHDNLSRSLDAARSGGTLESLRDGVEIVAREFGRQLEELGLERFDPTGEVFDPSSMEALGVMPVTDPAQDGKVVICIQPGFKLQGREIRPALVQVGRKV